jgi:acetoacetyl-[acyl-carrier protein] synthase
MSKNKPLAVISGFGGINSSGRSSNFLGYKNLVFNSLQKKEQLEVLQDLAILQGKIETVGSGWETVSGDSINLKEYLLENESSIRKDCFIRKIDKEVYDPDGIILDKIKASAAGQLPKGFDPSNYYPARQHPKALQMTIFGMSDAIGQLGFKWEEIQERINPDEVSVFSGAAIGQLDSFGFGGLMQSRIKGSRASSKNLALGLVEMSADFINAYVLGNVGRTGHSVGACATFLYNLQMGKEAIESGSSKVSIVGAAEAPITPEIIDGFFAMSALSDDKRMLELQASSGESIDSGPIQTRACRPFGNNAGMVLGESSQFVILMEANLAIELGVDIYGSVASVHSHSDGRKSSISGPGVGNYITMARCAADAEKEIGLKPLRKNTFVHAHGTGTPANRTTESHILNEIANTFGIKDWPITAIKSYLGHSMAPASGDQLIASLGTWNKGIIPGIHSTDALADDVYAEHLDILLEDKLEEPNFYKGCFLNAKGFGGNNASAFILSPEETQIKMKSLVTKNKYNQYLKNIGETQKKSSQYNRSCLKGDYKVTYKFNENVLNGETDIEISRKGMKLKGFKNEIKF